MSLQWTIVATFLYLEIAVVILLLLPIISISRWNKLFKSKFLISINNRVHLYFYGFLIVLILLFVDSVREMTRYSQGKEQDSEHGHLDAELQHSMKLFRAQRNFYVADFALFLYLVIRRLVQLINGYAQVIADQKASYSQAKSASEALRNYMSDGDKKGSGKVDSDKLQNELQTAKEDLKKLSAIKSQCDNLTKEYDRLSEENAKLQKKYDTLLASSTNKKSD